VVPGSGQHTRIRYIERFMKAGRSHASLRWTDAENAFGLGRLIHPDPARSSLKHRSSPLEKHYLASNLRFEIEKDIWRTMLTSADGSHGWEDCEQRRRRYPPEEYLS